MKKNTERGTDMWHLTKVDKFWNEIASQRHVFHVYENEDKFLDILAGFVGTGINADECTIVIATAAHLEKLKRKLKAHGLYVDKLIEDERYIPFAADEILAKFMVKDLPNEKLFFESISEIIEVAKKRNRSVRAFREMTTLLWTAGNYKATNRLEFLWDKYSRQETLSLFCAYPQYRFAKEECESLKEIGVNNSKIVRSAKVATEIMYKDCVTLSGN